MSDGETQSYGFDAMGNRLTKTDSSTGTTGYGYDAANRLTSTANNGASASAVTSDADGNTLTDTSGRTMTWDSLNRMASCAYQGTTSTFTYGADGHPCAQRARVSRLPRGAGRPDRLNQEVMLLRSNILTLETDCVFVDNACGFWYK